MIEYALILALLLLGAVAAMTATGATLITKWDQVQQAVARTITDAEPAPQKTKVQLLIDDFLRRMQEFHDKNNRWPRSWGDYMFTDIGLDPADWAKPVEGLYWGPNGDKLGIGLRHDDKTTSVYFKDMNGNTVRLNSGWKIWCKSDGCYYHTVAPQNRIDISTLMVVDTVSIAP